MIDDRQAALEEARNKKSQMPNAETSHPGDLHVRRNDDKSSSSENENSDENDHASRLSAARQNSISKDIKMAKDVAAIATPAGALSMVKQIDFLADIPYVAALGAAILKDIFDLGTFVSIVLPFIFSVLCGIFIFMMMLLVGAAGKRKGASKMLSKIGILGFGTIVDSIPGLDVFPVETATVIAIYVMELIERKNAARE